MASSSNRQPCIKCPKGLGITTCGGCEQWFCTKHFTEHRRELGTEMEHVGQEHDLLQRVESTRSEVNYIPPLRETNHKIPTQVGNVRQ